MTVFAYADCYGSGDGCVPDLALNLFLVVSVGGVAVLGTYFYVLRRWAIRHLMRRRRLFGDEWSYEDSHAPPLNLDAWRPAFRAATAVGVAAVPVAAVLGDWFIGLVVLLALMGLAGVAPFIYRDRWIWRALLRRD